MRVVSGRAYLGGAPQSVEIGIEDGTIVAIRKTIRGDEERYDFGDALVELGPEDVFDVPPGHDGWTIGDEPCVQLEWAGLRTWAAFPVGAQRRALVTILMTDIVDSTAAAKRLGDIAWRELLSSHYEGLRVALDRFSGREIQTTGDGMLATFDAPANALRCAATIRRLAGREAVQVRAAVHVGEVELVGGDIRGVAVHEAARIMARARRASMR